MPLNKVLGPDIPQNPLVFWFFWFFWFLFEVFWFLVVSVADKSLQSPKPKKRDENQLTATLKKQFLAQTFLVCIFVRWKKEQASEENPGPKHSWESFVFHFVVWCSLRFQNSKERKFRFDIILTLDKRKIKRKQKHAKRGTAQRCFLFVNCIECASLSLTKCGMLIWGARGIFGLDPIFFELQQIM